MSALLTRPSRRFASSPVVLAAFAALLVCAAVGCDKKSDRAVPADMPAVASAQKPPVPAEATATVLASAAPSAAPSASSAAAGGLKTLLVGPPEAGIKDSETIVKAGGVVLGSPPNWKGGNIYDAETIYAGPPVSPSIQGANILCHIAPKLDKATLHSNTYSNLVQKETWTEEVDGSVGVGGYPAKIGKGTGEQIGGKHEPVSLYYVYAVLPGASGVICGAAYPTSHPEMEKDVINAFKGMRNSKAK